MAQEKRGYFFQDTPDDSRFRAGDEPTEAEFRNLLDSVPFFQEDTSEASTGGKGLVRYSTQEEIDTESGDGVIRSKETPQVSVFNFNSSKIPSILNLNKLKSGARNVFQVSVSQLFLSFLEKATIPLDQGTTGQVLTKESGSDNFSFQDAPVGFSPSGTFSQYITGNGSYVDKYANLLLTGGAEGDVLTKISSNIGDWEWKELDTVPLGGTEGQALIKNSVGVGDYGWKSISSFTFQNEGSGTGIYDPTNSTSTDILFRSVAPSNVSANPVEVNLSSNGESIEIGVPPLDPFSALNLDPQFIDWGDIGTPQSNGYSNDFYGWFQTLVVEINNKQNV